MVTQRRGLRVEGVVAIVVAQVFLWRVGQEIQKLRRRGDLGVQLFAVRHHAKGIVVAAFGHALAAALAEIGNEDGEDSAAAGLFLFFAAEDRVDLAVGQGQTLKNLDHLIAGGLRHRVQGFQLGLHEVRHGGRLGLLVLRGLEHFDPDRLIDSGHSLNDGFSADLVRNVIVRGGFKDR